MLKEANGYSVLTNKKQRTKEAEDERDEEGIAESSIIGFDYRRVSMFYKEYEN